MRGYEKGRKSEGGGTKEGGQGKYRFCGWYRQLAADRYVHDRTLCLPTLCFVLTHAGRRERSPFEQRMVLGNKKPDPSNSFQSTSYSFELQAPLPSLAMELDLALGFRY